MNEIQKSRRYDTLKYPRILKLFEIKKIKDSLDIANPIGKRDYSMALLILRLGLKFNDILKMNIEDIDWDNNRLLIHEENHNIISIILSAEVRNALALYINYARPLTDNKSLFLLHNYPFLQYENIKLLRRNIIHLLKSNGIKFIGIKELGRVYLHNSEIHELTKSESLNQNRNTKKIYIKEKSKYPSLMELNNCPIHIGGINE